jgi:hypothetical protein
LSKPGIIYRIQQQYFHESTDVQTIVDIADTDNLIDDSDDPEIRELVSSGNPLELSVIDNDEDPMTSVKALQAICRFNSDSTYSMSTFLGGSRSRWKVHAYIGTEDKTVFLGFIVKSTLQESFMPVPSIVELTASDQVGLLKDIPLKNAAGDNPRGVYKIMDLVAMIMAQTGLSLEFRVAFNIKNSDLVDDISVANSNNEHFFTNNYLDAISFEDEINTSENCYSILQKILGEEAFITQRQGMWWIIRVDEIEDPTRGLYITSFDSDGQFVANLGEKTFRKDIVRSTLNNTIQVINAATLVKADLPRKQVRLDFNFNVPKEVPANVNFSRGDLIDGSNPLSKTYKLADWVMKCYAADTGNLPTSTAFIKRVFDVFGQETERYAVLTPSSAFNTTEIIESAPVPIGQGDKVTITFDFKLPVNLTGGAIDRFLVHAYLVDNSGNVYYITDTPNPSTGVFPWALSIDSREFGLITSVWERDDLDETKWNTLSYDLDEAPADGKIYICFHQFNQQSSGFDNIEIHLSNLKLSIHAKIAGTFIEYSGQYHQTQQAIDETVKREKEVFMSDSQRPIYKGSLLRISDWRLRYTGTVSFANGTSFDVAAYVPDLFRNGDIIRIAGTANNNLTSRIVSAEYHVLLSVTTFVIEDPTVSESVSCTLETPLFALAREFYNAAVFPAGPPSSDYVHTYGEIQLFDVWNQFKNVMRVFQLVAQGCDLEKLDTDSNVDHVHVVHKWSISDPSPHTYHRYFLLMHFRQNWRTAEWSGTMREVFNLDVAKDYSNHLFVLKPTNG